MMNLSVIGSGYVGTTLAASLADFGHTVTNVDIDSDVVEQINHGTAPIHEPGLQELISQYSGTRLTATTDYNAIADTKVTFLALPTPSQADGSLETSYIEAACESLGEVLREKEDSHLVVVKSTVTPGTTEETLLPLLEQHSEKTAGEDFEIAMNPEFLREGYALSDLRNPDKLVLGGHSDSAIRTLEEVYQPLLEENNTEVFHCEVREAEMIKYANNAFLATKISLINEIGNICKEYDVDAYTVADAIGLDERIGEQFLRSGVGWGGSCFPKDVAALIAAARDANYEADLLNAAVGVNDKQPQRMLDLLEEHTIVRNHTIAVLGLSFKPGTDDIRNSRAIPVIEALSERGANIVAYDPVVRENMEARFPDIEYTSTAEDALSGAHGALIMTDWDEFAALDSAFESMAEPVVVDGRRIVEPQDDIVYEGLTW